MRLCGPRLLYYSFLLLLVSAALAGAGGTLEGPAKAAISQSGWVDASNFGLVQGDGVAPVTYAHVDEMSSPDDCDRRRTSDHFAEKEWTWTLRCSPVGSRYYVTTQYIAQSTSYIAGDVDNFLDCDYARMQNFLSVKNDDSGEAYHTVLHHDTVSDPPAESYDKIIAVTSGPYSSACVGDGTQFSGSTKIQSKTLIDSEAWASASQVEWTLAVSYVVLLCQ